MTTTTIQRTFVFRTPTALESLLFAVAAVFRRCRARRELNDLTVEQLRDVGLDPGVLSREYKLPVDPWLTSRLQSLM